MGLALAAGACLALCACGSGGSPSAGSSVQALPGSSSATAQPKLTGHFCDDANAFMKHLPAGPAHGQTTVASARTDLHKVLHATIEGFTGLRSEAPAKLHKPLTRIVKVYRTDSRQLPATKSVGQMSQAVMNGNARASKAFQRLLKYIATSCK